MRNHHFRANPSPTSQLIGLHATLPQHVHSLKSISSLASLMTGKETRRRSRREGQGMASTKVLCGIRSWEGVGAIVEGRREEGVRMWKPGRREQWMLRRVDVWWKAAMAVRAGRTRKCVSAWRLLLQGNSCVISEVVWDGVSSNGAIVVLHGGEVVSSCVEVVWDCFALRLMPCFPPRAKFCPIYNVRKDERDDHAGDIRLARCDSLFCIFLRSAESCTAVQSSRADLTYGFQISSMGGGAFVARV